MNSPQPQRFITTADGSVVLVLSNGHRITVPGWTGGGSGSAGGGTPPTDVVVPNEVTISGTQPTDGTELWLDLAATPDIPDIPDGGMTEAEADARYVNITGDVMSGNLRVPTALHLGKVWNDGATTWDGAQQGGTTRAQGAALLLGVAGSGTYVIAPVGGTGIYFRADASAGTDVRIVPGGGLSVPGAATISGGLTASSALSVGGATTLHGRPQVNYAGISYPGFTYGTQGSNAIGLGWKSPNINGGVDNVNSCVLGTVSARKWKTGIAGLKGALAKVLKLRPVEYTPKDVDGSVLNARHAGLVADEVRRVLPGAVVGDGDAGTVNYLEVVPLLVAAVQELAAEVTALKESRHA